MRRRRLTYRRRKNGDGADLKGIDTARGLKDEDGKNGADLKGIDTARLARRTKTARHGTDRSFRITRIPELNAELGKKTCRSLHRNLRGA